MYQHPLCSFTTNANAPFIHNYLVVPWKEAKTIVAFFGGANGTLKLMTKEREERRVNVFTSPRPRGKGKQY